MISGRYLKSDCLQKYADFSIVDDRFLSSSSFSSFSDPYAITLLFFLARLSAVGYNHTQRL